MSDPVARRFTAFYDTETTGKWDFNAAWNAPQQPDLIQLGWTSRAIPGT